MNAIFLPMSIEEDRVFVYEPYGSKISQEFDCDELSGSDKFICLCLKNIQDKKAFLQDIAHSVKKMQRDMIQKAKSHKAICAL